MYNCDVDGCKKVYKTKSGLARHHRSKHDVEGKQRNIHPLNLKVFIREAAEKFSKDLALPEEIRKKFSQFTIASNASLLAIFKQFEPVFKGYNGNAEKFYSKMFQFSLPDKPQIFTSLPRVLSNLLITEISSSSLAYLVGRKNNNVDSSELQMTFQWNDKAKHVVEYLAGYCFRTIFTRLHRSKKRDNPEVQQIINLLKSAKLSDRNLAEKQRLINVKDRGGLWALNKTAVRIFEVCEEEFFTLTKGFKHSIDVNEMVPDLCKDAIIKGNFKDLCRKTDSEIDKEIQSNVLEKLVQLYLRVRTHAIAKSIKEKFKIASKDSKKKSLRTELKRATNDK